MRLRSSLSIGKIFWENWMKSSHGEFFDKKYFLNSSYDIMQFCKDGNISYNFLTKLWEKSKIIF